MRRLAKILIPSLFLAVFGYLLFWSFYFLPHYSPIHHDLKGRLIGKSNSTNQIPELLTSTGRFHSETHSQFQLTHTKIEFNAWLQIDAPGDYRFQLEADDSAMLRIGDHQLLTSSYKTNWRKPVSGTMFLAPGFHHVKINYQNEHPPAYMNLLWSPPGSTRFKPIPGQRLFTRIPSPEEKSINTKFGVKLTMIRILFFGLLVLTCIFIFIRNHKKLPWSIIKTGFLFFAAIFLLRIHSLSYDHQAGLRWFSKLSSVSRLVVVLLGLLIGSGTLRPLFIRIRRWIHKRPAMLLFTGFICVVLASTAQVCLTGLDQPKPIIGAWLFAASLLTILMVNHKPVPVGAQKQKPAGSMQTVFFWLAGITIMAVAIFFRFYRLHEMPPGLWWDEAQTGHVVRSILEGHFPPIYDLRINAGSVASYFNAAWCFIVDTTGPWGLRSYTAFIGVLTVMASWWFFRQLFSPGWSLVGMAFTAGSRWLFTINRTAMATIDETILLTFVILAMYFKAIRSNRWVWYISSGLLLGLAMHLHTGARVLPLIIGTDLVIRFWKHPVGYFKCHGGKAILMIICAMIAFSPMAFHIIKHTDDYMARSRETLLSTEYPGWYPVGPYITNIKYYLRPYNYRGDWHPRHNFPDTPQLPHLLAVCAALGAFLSLGRFRKHSEHRLLILGFCLVSMQGVLTVHGSGANLNRIAENIPIVMAWSVFGLEFITRGIKQVMSRKLGNYVTAGLCIIVISLSWWQAWDIYFKKYLPWKGLAGIYGFQPEITEMAKLGRSILDAEPETHVWAMYSVGDPFIYMVGSDPRFHHLTMRNYPEGKQDYPLVILLPARETEVLKLVKKLYPDAEETSIPYSLNPSFPLLRMFRVSHPVDEERRHRNP